MLNLIDFGFEGVVYPVGPSGGVITSRRIYESVSDIPDQLVANLGSPPGGVLLFDTQNRPLDLVGQLVGLSARCSAVVI